MYIYMYHIILPHLTICCVISGTNELPRTAVSHGSTCSFPPVAQALHRASKPQHLLLLPLLQLLRTQQSTTTFFVSIRVFLVCCLLRFEQTPTKEALEGKHVAFYFSSQAVEDQLEKAAQGQETVRPTPVVKEVRLHEVYIHKSFRCPRRRRRCFCDFLYIYLVYMYIICISC